MRKKYGSEKKYRVLSIIIPSFNEGRTLPEIIQRVSVAPTFGLKKEIIVIDDHSTDETPRILKKIRQKIKVITHERNQGKGAAIRTGLEVTTGDIVLIQDADLEYDPNEYELLIEPILLGKADVVYGSRFMGGRPHRVVYFWHAVTNRLLTIFSNMLTNINLSDMETCYKAFDGELVRKIAPELISDRFGFEPEITARASDIPGVRFYEVGISYYGRTYKEGKHIRWIDGIKAIIEIIRFNVFR